MADGEVQTRVPTNADEEGRNESKVSFQSEHKEIQVSTVDEIHHMIKKERIECEERDISTIMQDVQVGLEEQSTFVLSEFVIDYVNKDQQRSEETERDDGHGRKDLSKKGDEAQLQSRFKPYGCKQCGKCFSRSDNLARHERTHTGIKPYECKHCGKCFADSSHRSNHERIHTGIKPYECKQCGKCFSRSSNLTSHERTHTGIKPHECNHCGKCFTRSSDLAAHERMHTAKKPNECKHCGKCFSRPCDLARHERIHSGIKPYECKQCGKCFTQTGHLAYHERTHTGKKTV